MLKLQNMREGGVVEKVVRRHWMAFLNVVTYTIITVVFIITAYYVF